ncbi:hypothetical protein LIPSTDRAFT_162894 [Lipomyces starkeyi NRRL Y-11557]|uniref:Uncharacterized protein n=1 Tax=Lipomyces starkeyi NRRL Y-11557 TaxID=675824 RepID=A0A1E3Q1N5_LIPST|nr:hypothetical protein LIPSTDRAFT_162894 [Lipomyces starkeyi NRRL Y-11557]
MSAHGFCKFLLVHLPIWDTPHNYRAVKFKFEFDARISKIGFLNMHGLLNTVSTCTVIYYVNISMQYT